MTLLAPLASLDRSSPVINMPSNIRVPVYQSGSLQIADYISDMSPFSIMIDPDVTTDADENGIFDDDFTTDESGIMISDTEIRF